MTATSVGTYTAGIQGGPLLGRRKRVTRGTFTSVRTVDCEFGRVGGRQGVVDRELPRVKLTDVVTVRVDGRGTTVMIRGRIVTKQIQTRGYGEFGVPGLVYRLRRACLWGLPGKFSAGGTQRLGQQARVQLGELHGSGDVDLPSSRKQSLCQWDRLLQLGSLERKIGVPTNARVGTKDGQ